MFGRTRTTYHDDGRDAAGVEMLSLRGSPFAVDPPEPETWTDGSTATSATSWGVSEAEVARNRRGWFIGAALLGVLVVAVVTVSLATDDGAGRLAVPTPTTMNAVAPSTTRAPSATFASQAVAADTVPTVLVNSADDPFALEPGARIGYVLDRPPTGLTQVSAYSFPNDSGGNSPDADLQLWATPGATRSTGTWFVAQTQRVDAGLGFWPSGRRIAVGSATGALITAPDGVLELLFPTTATDGLPATATVMAFGLPEDALVTIASTIEVGADGLFTMATPPPPMINLVHSRSLPFRALDGPGALQFSGTVTVTRYSEPTTNDAPAEHRLSIAAADIPVDVAALLPFMLVDGHQEEIGGHAMWIGVDPASGPIAQPSVPMAVFAAEGRAVVVSGDADAEVLRDTLGSLHLASDDTWRNLLVDTMRHDRTTVYPESSPPGDAKVVASSETPGRPAVGSWRVSVEDGADIDMLVVDADDVGGYGIPMPSGPIIHVAVGEPRIIAVGIATPAGGPTLLRLTLDGAATPVQEAASVDVAGGVPVAALAFDSLGSYRLDLLDAAGTVIATTTG